MRSKNTALIAAALALLVCFAGSVFALNSARAARGNEATLEEVLYLPSGKTLQRLSLGYSSLLADIYWTRAVQYFGGRVQKSTHYELLDPLLEITTDLDPHLIVAYQDGSIFLAQQPTWGAGEPDKAVALLQKGIRNNPEYWRLYFTLGFVHYTDRHDYKAAEQAFRKGSEVPGALPWMKVMAARMAEKGADLGTAFALWQGIFDNAQNKDLKNTATLHLESLRADADLNELDRRVQLYREKTGTSPSRWSDLIRAGLLPGIPADPTGAPYKLEADGKVNVQDPSKFKFLGEFRNH
jgi:tetratricopeptide (TPR) repeat protein